MKRAFLCAGAVAALMSIAAGCVSTKAAAVQSGEEKEEEVVVKPMMLTDLPVVEFSGAGIKYECESMLLSQCVIIQDENASSRYAIRIENAASKAQMKVQLPAGTYECLVSEKAYKSEQSAFYVVIDENPYRMYPSNPPLGTFELTTRTPAYFTIDEPRTVLISIQAKAGNKNGDTGMLLDYIQFVKRK
jgi:hypothetical protein